MVQTGRRRCPVDKRKYIKMKYLIKRKQISENLIEKLMVPCGDPPEINPAAIKKYKNLKAQYQLKPMAGDKER